MPFYAPKKLQPYAITGIVLRTLTQLLRYWWLFAIAALFVLPQSPHLRIQYSFVRQGAFPIHQRCNYLGPRGMVEVFDRSRCPLILIIDVSNRASAISRLIPGRGS